MKLNDIWIALAVFIFIVTVSLWSTSAKAQTTEEVCGELVSQSQDLYLMFDAVLSTDWPEKEKSKTIGRIIEKMVVTDWDTVVFDVTETVMKAVRNGMDVNLAYTIARLSCLNENAETVEGEYGV